VADRLQSAEPLAAGLVLALPRQLACRTHSPAVNVNPQADQQLRVGVLTPGTPFHRLDLRVIEAQVQAANQLPDQARTVIFVDQTFDIDAAEHKLLAIDGGKSRLGGHAGVAHTRSLQMLLRNAMALLGRRQFLHSFQTGRTRFLNATYSVERSQFCSRSPLTWENSLSLSVTITQPSASA
jgi:hypothetical protein